MDRTLLLMRHAKSSWADTRGDHERVLNERGRRAARLMGDNLSQNDLVPELVLCSNAARTVETWERMSAAWSQPPGVHFLAQLYLPSVQMMVEAAALVPDSCHRLMVLSHNPACEDAVIRLTGQVVEMRTACVAVIHLGDRSWSSMRPGERAGVLRDLLGPGGPD